MNWQEVLPLIGQERVDLLKEDIREEDLPTQFYQVGEVHFFAFRSLYHHGSELKSLSEKFLFIKGEVYKYKDDQFEQVSEDMEGFVDLLYQRTEKFQEILLLYNEELDALEDQLFERKATASFLNDWFDLKKVMSKMERVLARQNFVFKDMIKYIEGPKKENKELVADYKTFVDDLSYLLHSVQGALNRLDNLHNFFSSLKDEKINRNIYFLTVLSGLFLPLNLIVGFFGMNTQGLFLADNPQGTFYVIYILVTIVALVFLGFNILRFVDKVLIRWWLGRTKFYHRINNRIESIEERWRF